MSVNTPPTQADESVSGFTRFWMFLINPHPSVQEIGERARAQLLAILTLILAIAYAWALLSRPESYNEFFCSPGFHNHCLCIKSNILLSNWDVFSLL